MPPLAERMRPKTLDDYWGQSHLIGEGAVLRKSIESNNIPSIIFWGPPGVGKTTLANIIANQLDRSFFKLSAINSGVKNIREVIESAKAKSFFNRPNPILFIDEIHRFSKSQQDSLLGAVENGTITLIGATTENPSFEVISALLSRSQVYVLEPLDRDTLLQMAHKALGNDYELKEKDITIKESDALIQYANGDGRKLYNTLEIVISQLDDGKEIVITDEAVRNALQQNLTRYDKGGEMHYDIASAFIKSIRGSDPNAAVYYLARMVAGGEDPKFICRRMLISASEDIGLANPNALLLANTCFDACHKLGYPEARIIMSQCAIYLATSPKSNASYQAINEALSEVSTNANLSIPLHLRNAPTKLMKDIGYGKDYKYAHSFDDNFVNDEYLPDEVKNSIFYVPQNNAQERRIREQMHKLWKGKYGY